jgi:hypothetical protein
LAWHLKFIWRNARDNATTSGAIKFIAPHKIGVMAQPKHRRLIANSVTSGPSSEVTASYWAERRAKNAGTFAGREFESAPPKIAQFIVL